jgi:DNA polymerase-3 subunit delta
VIRSLQRRVLMLAPMRARVERGERPDAVMTSLGKALFFKDKANVGRMLRTWSAAELATIAARAGTLERTLMFVQPPEQEALGEELLAIGRKARSR